MFCRTCVPQFLICLDLYMEWKSISLFRVSVVLISSDIFAHGFQHSYSLIMTLSSCASASACCGSLHTSSPQPGFGIDILPSTLILSKGSNTTVLVFTSSLPSFQGSCELLVSDSRSKINFKKTARTLIMVELPPVSSKIF